jgi:hypothetical protein
MKDRHEKAPPFQGEALDAPTFCRRTVSGDECLTRAVDHGLQRFRAGVLIGVKAFAVTGDAMLVDDGEAEAAFARCHDQAVHRSEGVGEGADCSLGLDMSSHV